MGRAPHTGGPQRVSPHVVPKKLFSDDDEKTTIESDQWGDEASTTVEQGEVAEKMRALGFDTAPPRRPQATTNVTRNTAAAEESTVDEGNGQIVTPPMLPPARLVITGGNDAGIETAIAAGKQYTIGRGLDNDIVLTDIAVSRKHFDLRNEAGSWVIVDRGSGNGTVVNGNLEDNPFMLAHGDVIEIGNTSFRFDFVIAESPVPRGAHSNGFDSEDEEMSTVAGKQLRSRDSAMEWQREEVGYRAEPLPPARGSFNEVDAESIDVELHTDSPAVAAALQRPVTQPPPPSRSYSRPKTLPPPTPLRARTMSQPPAYPSTQPQGTPGPMPVSHLPSTTLPMPQMQSRAPNAPTMLAAEPIHLHNVLPTTLPGQGMPVQGHHAVAQSLYANGYPQAHDVSSGVHAQMIIAGQNKRGDLSTAHVQPIAYPAQHLAPPQRYSSTQPLSKKSKYVIVMGGITVLAAVATLAIIRGGGSAETKAEPKKPVAAGSGAITQKTITPIAQPPVTPPTTPKQDPPKQVANTAPPPKQDPPKQDPPKQDPPKQDPPKQIVKNDPPKKQDPPKQQTHTQPPKQEKPDKVDKVERPDPPKTRVAVADPTDRAEALYRDKKFLQAADLYSSAAKAADGDDAAAYKLKATRLSGLAHAYNTGMAPGAKEAEAFDALVQANNLDQNLGGRFESEITTKMSSVVAKAAVSYIGRKAYEQARIAVLKAESLGKGSDNNIQFVKQQLEIAAQKLYADAMKDYDSNPSAAKEKLKRVKSIVDAKSSTYQKANAKLSGA